MRPAMIRTIDSQGRIIIPSEIRKTMNLARGDALEIRTGEDEIRLSKYSYASAGDSKINRYLEILCSVIRCGTAVCSEETILASKGAGLLAGTRIHEALAAYVMAQRPVTFDKPVYAAASGRFPVDTLIPLKAPDFSCQQMALLLFSNGRRQVSAEERLCARVVAALITAENQTLR